MPILRLSRLLAVALFAAGSLIACKGSSSSSSTPSGPTALLRIVQGNPALQAVDYKVDSSGTLNLSATAGAVQPYLTVTAAAHTVYFYESGTNGNTPVNSTNNCPLPALATGVHYTLVLVAFGAGGTSAAPGCVLYTEPAVTASAGQGIVVYHNVAGNATVVDANGNVTPNLYPIFCQPVGTIVATGNQPCVSPTVPPGGPIVNGAVSGGSPTAVQIPVTYASATAGAGVAFSVTNAPGGTPLCQGLSSDPTLYPKNFDSTDGSNFVPNGANDQVISIFVTDSVSATSGSNACPVTISGSTAI